MTDPHAVLLRLRQIAVRYEQHEIEAKAALEEMLGELDAAGYSPILSVEVVANDDEG